MAFLQQVAQQLYQTFGDDISNIHVVLPSRRSCLYFRWYLSDTVKRTLLAPQIMAMNDFVMRLSDIDTIDSITGVFELFQSYKKFDTNPEHLLEQFIPLGNALLRDFSMIDKNLKPEEAAALFEYLDELKAIERWGSSLGQEVEIQQRVHLQDYFSFWKNVKATFAHFKEHLLSQNLAYGGLAYRKMCESLEDLPLFDDITHVAFVGFNQMSRAEEDIIKHLVKEGKASTFWDTDRFYLENKQHEAGMFLRRYRKSGIMPPNYQFPLNNIRENTPDIRVIGVNNRVAQAKLAGQLLQEILEKEIASAIEAGACPSPALLQELIGNRINHTAILMPDEALLLPLLHSLPNKVAGEVVDWGAITNLTMGIKMYHTSLFSWVEVMFQMQDRLIQEEDGKWQVYCKDWNKLASHPLMQLALRELEWQDFISKEENQPENIKELSDAEKEVLYGEMRQEWRAKWPQQVAEQQYKWLKQNRLYLSLEDLWADETLGSFYKMLFNPWQRNAKQPTGQAILHFYQLIDWLLPCFRQVQQFYDWNLSQDLLSEEEGLLNMSYRFEYTFLLQFHQMLNKLEQLLEKQQEKLSLPIFKQFLQEDMRQQSVPFSGEPLSPVQIMGLLESRSLDFDHVVILSCNETILPQGKSEDSLIPFELRKRVGIPTHKESDGSIAYIFYRLFQRSKSVTLVYTAPNGANRVGEYSRFISQLQAELPEANISWEHAVMDKGDGRHFQWEKQLKKTPAIRQLIIDRLARGISPSAINGYIRNPLEFFSRYVLRIEEEQQLEETMERSSFGTLVHQMIENLLKPYEGELIDQNRMEFLAKQSAQIMAEAEKVMAEDLNTESDKGGNYVLKQVAARLIERFFQEQAASINSYHLVAQEFGLKHRLDLQIGEEKVTVNLYGQADRIDIADGVLRVVDYKTGSYHSTDLKAKDGHELLVDTKKGKVIQLMIYRYLLIQAVRKGDLKSIPSDFLLTSPDDIEAGFYFFTQLSDGFIKHSIIDAPTDTESFIAYVEQWIKDWVIEILDPTKVLGTEIIDELQEDE